MNKDITLYDIGKGLEVYYREQGFKRQPGGEQEDKAVYFRGSGRDRYCSYLFANNLRRQRTNIIGMMAPLLNSTFSS